MLWFSSLKKDTFLKVELLSTSVNAHCDKLENASKRPVTSIFECQSDSFYALIHHTATIYGKNKNNIA